MAHFTFWIRQGKHAGSCRSPFSTGRTNKTDTVEAVDIQCHLLRPGMLWGDLRGSQGLTNTTGLNSRPCCISTRQYLTCSGDDSPALITSFSNWRMFWFNVLCMITGLHHKSGNYLALCVRVCVKGISSLWNCAFFLFPFSSSNSCHFQTPALFGV